MDDKLYFDNETLSFVNTEMLFRLLAHHDLQIEMKFNPESFQSKQDAITYLEERRGAILRDMFTQFGKTPDLNDIIKS